MKLGIIGLPQVGKRTLFSLLTGEDISQTSTGAKESVKMGTAHIRDHRLDKLNDIYKPKKKVYASLELVLLPKFDKKTITSGEFLKSMENCDALCHIVRAFEDDAVFHVNGSVDALRDIDSVYTELILSDLILVEKRLERIEKELQHKLSTQQAKEKEILLGMKEALDKNLPLITFSLNDQDKKMMSTYQFLTTQPMIIVLNVNENKLNDGGLVKTIEDKYKNYHVRVMQVSAKIESELLSLEKSEREAFLKDLKITKPALNRMTRLCYESLGLISFFTVGPNEVHAWCVKKNSLAPEAAGAIHTDMQRGFIRAEIMKSSDLIEMGDESKVKEAGRFFVKGKDYVMQDGDVMRVRFNV